METEIVLRLARQPCSRTCYESATVRQSPAPEQLKLPTHLAHPPEDNRAVAVHALGSSLQGSRQNCSEPCRLFQANIPGCGSIVVRTRRLGSVNTGAPFDHVEVNLQNAPFAEDQSAIGTNAASAPLRRKERPVPKNRFLTSCCVIVEAPRVRSPSISSCAAIWI